MDNEIAKTALKDKKLEDLTVGDSVKINLIFLAATAGTIAVVSCGAAGYERIADRLKDRKAKKAQTNQDQ